MNIKPLLFGLAVIVIFVFLSVNNVWVREPPGAVEDKLVQMTAEIARLHHDMQSLQQEIAKKNEHERKQPDTAPNAAAGNINVAPATQEDLFGAQSRKRCYEDGAPPVSVPEKWQAYYGGANTFLDPNDGEYNKLISELFGGKKGFETGGPSGIFRSEIKVYPAAASIDNSNFSNYTIWEGHLKDGSPFKYMDGKEPGIQYVRDAVDLHGIADNSYDFVITAHVLEHFANPFRAVYEWARIIRPGGIMLLILPWKEGTFDHNRSPATLDHLVQHWKDKTPETDLSHLEEILEKHDLPKDPGAGSRENFIDRSHKNSENRALHQHIFDYKLLIQMYYCFNFEVLDIHLTGPFNQIIIGRKME